MTLHPNAFAIFIAAYPKAQVAPLISNISSFFSFKHSNNEPYAVKYVSGIAPNLSHDKSDLILKIFFLGNKAYSE